MIIIFVVEIKFNERESQMLVIIEQCVKDPKDGATRR